MKKMIPTLLAALVAAALSTPTSAFADVYSECAAYYHTLDEIRACIERERETLIAATSEAEAQVVQLRQAQASAASAGDGPEVMRLQQELAAVTAERDEYKSQLDAANAEIRALRGDVDELRNEVAELKGLMTSFLEAEAVRPIAAAAPTEEPAHERVAPSDGEARLAAYRPELDPTVYDRMAYVGYEPEIPSPIAHPDVPWRDAGNCLRIMNITDWYMFIRVDGARFYLDESGHTTLDEVLLAPGESVGHCQGERAITQRTAARISTAPSSERHWDGRRWVSVERSSWTLRYPGRYSPVDRIDRDGGPDFRE